MATSSQVAPSLLTDAMLESFSSRAATYDRDNAFFSEDFAEIQATGFLKIPVPSELGGAGMDLSGVGAELRRLAYRAPATALGVMMHLHWPGLASDLLRRGDKSLSWVLSETVAGEVFASGFAEPGNDRPMYLANSKAQRGSSGYEISGHKSFTSLTPVWTRLAVIATAHEAGGTSSVYGFVERGPGIKVANTWDAMGMRATRSDDTLLEGVPMPERYIARVLDTGQSDFFVLALLAWAELMFANVYIGIAMRAKDLAVTAAKGRKSITSGLSMAHNSEVQHLVADMVLRLDSVIPQVDRVAADWCTNVNHAGEWLSKLVGAKHNSVEGAKYVVDTALRVCGASALKKGHELERLYRDVRCGEIHPASPLLAYEYVAKTALGLPLGGASRS